MYGLFNTANTDRPVMNRTLDQDTSSRVDRYLSRAKYQVKRESKNYKDKIQTSFQKEKMTILIRKDSFSLIVDVPHLLLYQP